MQHWPPSPWRPSFYILSLQKGHSSKDLIQVELCNICPFCGWLISPPHNVFQVHSCCGRCQLSFFLGLTNILSCGWTTLCLSHLPFMDTCWLPPFHCYKYAATNRGRQTSLFVRCLTGSAISSYGNIPSSGMARSYGR